MSPIGTTGLNLPSIVFGSSALGNLYQELPGEVKRQIVSEWFRNAEGVVAVDSAGKYGAGLSLECIGEILGELGTDAKDIVISNKLGWRRAPLTTHEPTFEPGAWFGLKHDAVQDISYDGILRCWEEGNQLLGDYPAQMVSVHDPDEYLAAATDSEDRKRRWNDVLEAYRALGELRESGKAAAIGVGSKDWRVSQELARHTKLDWVMLACSLTIYSHPADLLDFVASMKDCGTAVINSAVFNAGFLTGGNFFDYREVTGDTEEDRQLLAWRARFQEICRTHGVTPAEACVAFGMSPPGVVSIALNTSKPQRVASNVSLANASPPDAFWQAMKEANLIDQAYPHLTQE